MRALAVTTATAREITAPRLLAAKICLCTMESIPVPRSNVPPLALATTFVDGALPSNLADFNSPSTFFLNVLTTFVQGWKCFSVIPYSSGSPISDRMLPN